jgi:iron-sulfur cluster assembly 2
MEDQIPGSEDIVVEKDGTKVVVDTSSLELIKGATIDYTQELIRSAFSVVNNPQSESACGCGSSFAVKNFQSNPALD